MERLPWNTWDYALTESSLVPISYPPLRYPVRHLVLVTLLFHDFHRIFGSPFFMFIPFPLLRRDESSFPTLALTHIPQTDKLFLSCAFSCALNFSLFDESLAHLQCSPRILCKHNSSVKAHIRTQIQNYMESAVLLWESCSSWMVRQHDTSYPTLPIRYLFLRTWLHIGIVQALQCCAWNIMGPHVKVHCKKH